MPNGVTNRPRTQRGAFVEYGLTVPPLLVVFQFNPLELSRNRSLSFQPENQAAVYPIPRRATEGDGLQEPNAHIARGGKSLREWHKDKDLLEIQDKQQVSIQEEGISFDIRLDATDKLADGDPIAAGFGIAPQLATLERMVLPAGESELTKALGSVLDLSDAFTFKKDKNPPIVLFIWGLKRILPVNIDSLQIKETEFSPMLDPIRATVSVTLTVIEGTNALYRRHKVAMEAASALNLASVVDIAHVAIPG